MKVVVSSAGRFHSVNLAKELLESKNLYKFFYAGMPQDKEIFKGSDKLNFNFGLSFADRVFNKLGLERFYSNSKWYVFRDSWFDSWVKSSLEKDKKISEIDLFVGWANACLKTIEFLKKKKIPCVIESGSMHILEQKKILEEEYLRRNIKREPVCKQNVERMLLEYELADFIAVPSELVKKSFLANGFSEKKILKLPYGSDVKKFSASFVKRVPSKKVRFLFAGQVSLQKGIDFLIKAWQQLNLPSDLAELIIVGQVNSDSKEVLNSCKLESVSCLGPVKHEEMPKIYSNADIFVLPSLQEGLAMVIGEAMASGLAVVCSDKSGGSELIEEGVEGFIFPAGNVDSLCEKMLWCLRNKSSLLKMGISASEKIKNFSWQGYGDRVLSAYKKIISEKSR